MKNILKSGLLLLALHFIFVACQEDEIETYHGPDAVNLLVQRKDSAEFSFLNAAPSLQEYIFEIEVQIQTIVQDRDRVVNLGLGDRTTGKLGTNFEVAKSVTIPAGETTVILPVKVFKEGLKDIEGGLVADIVVEPSVDFIAGVYGKMKLAFSGDFPKDWYSSTGDVGAIPYFWGKCTKAKYEFVYNYIGTIDLKQWANWDYTPIIAMQGELNAELDRIAAETGERVKDDDGSDMYFSANT